MSARARLECFVNGSVCVLGIGNRRRRDDGVGSLIVEALAGRTSAALVDAGEVPENHLERVVRCAPDTVLMVDAVDVGAEPGALRLVPPEALRGVAVSTHSATLDLCARYLSRRTGAPVALLGIQPGDLGAGTGLSRDVAAAADEVCTLLSCLLPVDAARAAASNAPTMSKAETPQ